MKVTSMGIGLVLLALPSAAEETIRLVQEKPAMTIPAHVPVELLSPAGDPAVFSGDTGVKTHGAPLRRTVYLFADSSFVRIDSPQARSDTATAVVDMGVWTISRHERILTLHDGLRIPLRFTIEDRDRLMEEPLPDNGTHTEPIILRRTDQSTVHIPSTLLSGMYSYMADAGIFRECRTGKPWPVAMEEDNIRLESAYMDQCSEPAEELFVTFTGRLEHRFPMEGSHKKLHIIVETFHSIHPDRRCGAIIDTGRHGARDSY